MQKRNHQTFLRRIKASWRDTGLLLGEFSGPLLVFILAIVGCGYLYFLLAAPTPYAIHSPAEAIYLMLTLTFLQANSPFPEGWYLQSFFFLMPVLGIGILAQGLADFGVLFFNRRARGKEWEMAVASTFSNHVVLIGLGHLGFKVIKQLNEMEQDVVAIEQNPRADLITSIRAMGIPVIDGDGTRQTVLESACISRARSIILCTQNDSLNLQMAVKARTLNPKIHVVVRIFDDDFAKSLQQQFGFIALSATGMAAPIFAASAAGADITAPITVEGVPQSLARLNITPQSRLDSASVDEIEDQYEVSVVLVHHNGQSEFHPVGQQKIMGGDIIAVFGNPTQINLLVNDSQR